MSKPERPGDLEEIFEILVTSYSQRSGSLPGETELSWRPAADAYETQDAFIVQIELAGLDPARIEVLADTQSLVVRGIRQDASVPGKKHFHEMEISVGPFARKIPLIPGVDPASAQARYRNGFLFVTFAKRPGPAADQRNIAVDQ
ncbi:MAG: Hsp20/alpha crystallin family protein [bacterium]